MDILKQELERMNISCQAVNVIQDKDGVIVARVTCENKTLILKFFQNQDFRREIENYRMLSSLGIPTLDIITATDKALLMEDILASNTYRLGTEEDLNNPETAVLIARWYKQLHHRGYEYIQQSDNIPLYDENDVITADAIKEIQQKTNTSGLPIWKLIEANLDLIRERIGEARRTITYNDFYYTNLIVSKDGSSAMMFDYNLLGKGYAYADIRNVCSALTEKAQKAFCEEYGKFDESEVIVDEVASVLTNLHFACQRAHFPDWAKCSVTDIKSPEYTEKVKRLLCLGN